MQPEQNLSETRERLFSLDFFRGFTMFLLIAESTELYSLITSDPLDGTLIGLIGTQFQHHAWHGLHFWDLIQPFFMFIVGVAIPFSIAKRRKSGQTQSQIRKHVVLRSLLLLLFGWSLYCIGAGKIGFHFQNVLAQLAFTYLVACLIMNRTPAAQIILSVILIAITEIIYRTFPVAGFNHPFTANENFGTWLDLQYGGANLSGHWVSFNAIPTTAHTIWGVLAGQLLMSDRSAGRKLKILVIAGLAGVIAGYALDPVTPVIKRICTSSFVLVSGGWTFLALAFSFWLIDMKNQKKWTKFFVIVGMNSLFIYLFSHVGGTGLIRSIVRPFSNAVFGWTGELSAQIFMNGVVLLVLWYLCYWMYTKKIFIKI